jgi:dTDP-4-dehydrorhamnose 3,5-epimerase
LDSDFIQDNHSKSAFGTIRGLHFQTKPYGQSKLVRCVSGAILDVAVDIRPWSKTFGKYFSVILNSDNNYQLWIPYGFAHGFQVLSEIAEVNYKVDEYWQPKFEGSIRYDDPDININWKKIPVQISDKDKSAKFLKEIKDF